MPISCTINAKANYILLQGSGIVTDQEYLAVVAEVYGHPDFSPCMRSLMDLRDVTDNKLSPATLEESAKGSRFHPKTRRAVIVGSKTDFHLAREHQSILSLHSKSRTRLFHTSQDALEFLNEGLPKDQHIC